MVPVETVRVAGTKNFPLLGTEDPGEIVAESPPEVVATPSSITSPFMVVFSAVFSRAVALPPAMVALITVLSVILEGLVASRLCTIDGFCITGSLFSILEADSVDLVPRI